MKRQMIAACIAVAAFLLSGCNVNSFVSNTSQADAAVQSAALSQSVPAAEDVEPAGGNGGVAYIDPNIDMSVYLEGRDWLYEKDENGQVFFYLPWDVARNNVISISSQKIQKDAESDMRALWKMLKEQAASIAIFEDVFTEISAGKHQGKELDFTMDSDYGKIYGKYLVWNSDDKIYTCSVTADQKGTQQVNAALDSILKSFNTYQDLNANN